MSVLNVMKFVERSALGWWSIFVLFSAAQRSGAVIRDRERYEYLLVKDLSQTSERHTSNPQLLYMDTMGSEVKKTTLPSTDRNKFETTMKPILKKSELSCDPLPLVNGSNVWDGSQQKIQRIHTDESEICGPKVLIVGAMKCGTNTVGHLLAKHPRIKVNRCDNRKSVRGSKISNADCNDTEFQGSTAPQMAYWEGNDLTFKRDQRPDTWLKDLAKRLPWTDGIHNITIDKSPGYLNTLKHPELPQLAKSLLPSAKILVTVCNPSARMYSEFEYRTVDKRHYHLENEFLKYGYEVPTNFIDFARTILKCNMEDEENNERTSSSKFCQELLESYLRIGEYAMRLRGWYDVYGEENVLVVNMDSDPASKVSDMLSFLGDDILPREEFPWHELENGSSAGEFFINDAYEGRNSSFGKFPRLMTRLQEHYAPYNEVLAAMIGKDFPLEWNR
jgi:hypothetical protein